MKKWDEFTIPFLGLEPGKYEYEFKIDKEFFEIIETDLYTTANINLLVTMHKSSTMLSFDLAIKGTMPAECFRCLASSEINFDAKEEKFFVAKIGSDISDTSSEEIIAIGHGESSINIVQQVFDFFHSQVPQTILPCEINNNYKLCNQEVLEKLTAVSVKAEQNNVDPRWEALSKLKDKN
jgi:uncharacterized metal-binding protein YceD (DUF177 family)